MCWHPGWGQQMTLEIKGVQGLASLGGSALLCKLSLHPFWERLSLRKVFPCQTEDKPTPCFVRFCGRPFRTHGT